MGAQIPLRKPQVDIPEYLTRGLALHQRLGEGLTAFRAEQLRKISAMSGSDPYSQGVRWNLLQRLVNVAKLNDPHLERDYALQGGAILAGDIPPCPRWGPRKHPEVFSENEYLAGLTVLQATHSAARSLGQYHLPSPRDRPVAWKLLVEERDAGAWSGPWTEEDRRAKHGPFLAWLYFVVRQEKWEPGPGGAGGKSWVIKTKERGCLDPSGLNQAPMTVLPDKCHMAGAPGVLALYDACVLSSPEAEWHYFSDDVVNGFRIVDLQPSQSSLFGATAENPETGEVMFFFPLQVPFGPRGGPHVFSRPSEAVAGVQSVLLALPTAVHVDDTTAFEWAGLCREASWPPGSCMTWLGCP